RSPRRRGGDRPPARRPGRARRRGARLRRRRLSRTRAWRGSSSRAECMSGFPPLRAALWTQLERLFADPHLVPGREARPLERRDHADLAQALLEVGERLRIPEVVAREEQLDSPAANTERAILGLDREPLVLGAVRDVLGLELRLAGPNGDRAGRSFLGNGGEDRPAKLVQPGAG